MATEKLPLTRGLRTQAPGLLLALTIAVIATVIGSAAPILGAPVAGVILGVVVAAVRQPGQRWRPGLRTASRPVLQLSIVLLGSQLSLAQVATVGVQSLPVLLGSLVAALAAAWLLGRWLGIVGDLRTLIGVGTAICGASAIAAVTPVIGAASVEVAYAVSTIFLFNIAAVLTFPVVGQLLQLDPQAFGLFAGTAVNDMSSVVAAATSYGAGAVDYAVVVKLVRTLMIIPIVLVLAAWVNRRGAAVSQAGLSEAVPAEAGPSGAAPPRGRPRVGQLVPWFLVGFVLAAAANSAGLIPFAAHPVLTGAAVFLITVALSAIGLSTDLAGFRRAGPRPLLLGGLLWIVVAGTSLGLLALSGAVR